MIQLSVVIITLNEEKNIEACLKSVYDLADEIVVLDSFSTDATVEICEKYKVNLIQKEWEGYSKSKNYANEVASYDWVFSIDADEVVSEELKKDIFRIKECAKDSDAFILKRITNFCGKWIRHCGWYPDPVIRIWNKKFGQWEGSIHEKLLFSKEMNRITLEGDLYHYSFRSISQHLKTIDKFTELSAQERFEKGKRSSILSIIFKPMYKFFSMYILKAGILDGYYGFVVCRNSAFSAYLKQIKLKELQKKNVE